MESNLPNAEIIRAEQTMTIVQKSIQYGDSVVVETVFEIDDRVETLPAVVQLYKIDVTDTFGVIPARSWHDGTDIRLLFYVSQSIPLAHRPFAEGMYAFIINNVSQWTRVVYPIGDGAPRVLIDQVLNGTSISYVVLFAASEYDKIVTRVIEELL